MNVTPLSTRVTDDGAITLPREAVERLGVRPGEEVDVAFDGSALRVVRHAEPPGQPVDFRKFIGIAKDPDGLSTDEVMRLMRGDPDW